MFNKFAYRCKHLENLNTCLKLLTQTFGREAIVASTNVHCKPVSTTAQIYDHGRYYLNPALIRSFSTCSIRPDKLISKCDSVERDDESTLSTVPESISNIDVTVEADTHVDIFDSEDMPTKPNVLQPVTETTNFYLENFAPPLRQSFNVAPFADKSETIKKLLALGVEVALWEKDLDLCTNILKLDFDVDIKPYIFFLHRIGVPADSLGKWLTINPYILQESIENLEIRINYLQSKKFSDDSIKFIINRVPKWLSHNTFDIDAQLGRLQKKFKLTGSEVRHVVTRDPKLILFSIKKKFHIERAHIMVNVEFGFELDEINKMLLECPRIFRTRGEALMRRIDLIHNKLGFSHEAIASCPRILLTREQKVLERSSFLKEVGRDQYDPSKPNYVAIDDFCVGPDQKFCTDVAKLDIKLYDDFLKTL